ncbi:hypothetical protein DN068_16020 [Taibaiella soli]|uniref:Uncharacterized protein n=2 Tax=Taibaiella soli TaxID=1649169 RepID=A0A2W2AH82_9BACT|nr:hypothetical protein DN068_16020 [Taibaiella soli]
MKVGGGFAKSGDLSPKNIKIFSEHLQPLNNLIYINNRFSMTDFITFKGLKHYPVGNAHLQPGTDGLTISNLSTPLDGITIETKRATFFDLQFNPVFIENDTDFGVTFNLTDNSNSFRAMAQWAIAQHLETSVAYLFLNSKLEGEQIMVTGFNAGNNIFQRVFEQTGIPGYNWMIVGVFDLAYNKAELTGIDCRMAMIRDKAGKVIEVTIVKSFRCKGIMTPTSGKSLLRYSNKIRQTQSFAIDSLQIASSLYYPGGLPEEKEGYISQAVITGQGMPALVLTEEYSGR